MRQRRTGFTLMEMLIVIAVTMLVLAAVVGIIIQTSRIYSRTMVHPSPQSDLDLAMKRIEPDFRTAMAVTVNTELYTASDGTRIELVMPEKDPDTGLNVLYDSVSSPGLLVLAPGETVRFFLGDKIYPDPNDTSTWTAMPDATGTTLFRVDDSVLEQGGLFYDAPVVIDDLLPPTPDLDVSNPQYVPPIFEYGPDDASSPPEITTRLVRITLTKARDPEITRQGTEQYPRQTLWTQYCIRNLVTSGQGP